MTNQLIYGLVTGVLFGFFLQRGQVLRYDKQIGALRLMDMTILKFMLTAIFVGCVGIYLLKDLGWSTCPSKRRSWGPRLSAA
jgi:Na+/H+-dicarboxylate symporter